MTALAPNRCSVCGEVFIDETGNCAFCLLQLGLETSISGGRSGGGSYSGTPANVATIDEAVLPKFGDYELLSEIARGGMGVVYRARQISLNRLVAIKLILAGQLATRESIQRFRLEAEAAAKLHHPGIVPIYEIGEYETQHFFSMELIEGASLAECLDEFVIARQLVSTAHRDRELCVAEMAVRVARALDFAHQHGVLHRDLKPSNILIDQDGYPHLTDFGLAKLTGREASGLTLSHAVLGTPGYLAPEQAAGRSEVTTAADVYGLGATLYELLVGDPPFVGETAMATMMQAINQDPRPPRQLNAKIHPDLETIVLRCLEKQPEKRYPSAGLVADELERFLRREPILARPISQLERSWRWCQRHPGASIMASVALMAILVGIGATWSQWYRATQANISLKENVEHLRWDLIDDMLHDGDASRALARIATLVREDPDDWRAAMLGISVIERHRFPVPAIPPIRHPNGAEFSVARLSPNGRAIVTASSDHTARLWDSATGEALVSPMQHDARVNWAEFSPDGLQLATCSDDTTVRLWDAATGKQIGAPLRFDGPVAQVHYSSDGKSLVGQTDRSVTVYDTSSRELKLGPLTPEIKAIKAKFLADGKNLFVAQNDGQGCLVQLYDVESGEVRLSLRPGPFVDADINTDLSRVAIVSGEQCSIWDVKTGKSIGHFTSTGGRMVEVRFSPDGDKVAVIGFDHWVRILNAVSVTPLTPQLPHGYLVNGLDFVPNGTRLMSWGDDSLLKLWDSTTGELYAQPMKHSNRVQYAESSAQTDHEVFLATISHLKFGSKSIGAGTGAAQLWRIHSLCEPEDRSRGDHYGHNGSTLSADGKLLALGTNTNEVWVMQTQTGQTVCGPLPIHGGPWGVFFTPDAHRLITTSSEGQVAIWSVPSGELLFERRLPTTFQPAEMSSDGVCFVTGSTDGFVRVWDSTTGDLIWEQLHGAEINSVAISSDGRFVANGGEDRTATVWDMKTGALLHRLLGHQNEVTRVGFSPDNRRLITASQDFSARVWDATSGKLLLELPHQGEVLDAKFSPDGRSIATGSRDRTAIIWDAVTGKPKNRPLIHLQTVHQCHFTPDSKRLLTVDDHGLQLWDVGSGHSLTARLPHPRHAGDGFQSSPFDVHLTPDGESFFMSANCRQAKLWHVPVPPKEIPDWFPALMEAIAGQRYLVGKNTPEVVPPQRFLELQQHLRAAPDSDFYTRWARRWIETF